MLGRYAHRYGQMTIWEQDTQPVGILEKSGPMRDLATATFGRAHVSCVIKPREIKWGRHYDDPAAIMQFRMRAISPENCKLSDFELDMRFSPTTLSSVSNNQEAIMDSSNAEQLRPPPHHEIYLLELPAPTHVPESPHCNQWAFSSHSIPNPLTGQLTTARWVLRSRIDQGIMDGRLLHAGVALRHHTVPFQVTCQVRGRIAKPGGVRLRFSDEHHTPRVWQIVPESCLDNLQPSINDLERHVSQLNVPAGTRTYFQDVAKMIRKLT